MVADVVSWLTMAGATSAANTQVLSCATLILGCQKRGGSYAGYLPGAVGVPWYSREGEEGGGGVDGTKEGGWQDSLRGEGWHRVVSTVMRKNIHSIAVNTIQ